MRLLVLVVLVAGCASSPAANEPIVDDQHGRIVGVVVDQSIMPVPGALVVLATADEPTETTTDDEGRFVIEGIAGGAHVLAVSKLNYQEVQTSVHVVPGVAAPEVVRVQLERLYGAQPFMGTQTFSGVIQCGYAVAGIISSLCANDYTRFIPIIGDDPKCPQCEHLLGDKRGHDFEIFAGWQTGIFEMTWEPSAQGTSERMRLILSHTPRPATHWYAATASQDPLLLRVEQGVVHEDQQSEPSLIPPEGLPNAHFFAATNPMPGEYASVAISQPFEVYYSLFYYGKPPEGWSFIAGDENPF